jgi:outer membrane beta-barrel protein
MTPKTLEEFEMPKTSVYLANAIRCATLSLLSWTAPLQAGDLDAARIRGDNHVEPVTVLQNRYFLKTLRPEVGFILGSMINEAYTDTRAIGVRAGVFWSEWFGVEYQFLGTQIKDTPDRAALNTLKYRPLEPSPENADLVVSPDPEVNPIHRIDDLNFIVAPFYGKLNLLGRHIIYSDLYLTAGFSRVLTDQRAHPAFSWGAGQRFYFSEHWSIRLDFKDRMYQETRAHKQSNKNAYSFDFGASYFFL